MDNPKIVAFYLPQFHSIPENDEWWGLGFTEWVNLKRAEPVFPGHRQPRVPLHGNYYNLLDPAVWKWQEALAREHGIDAFCYYHYWFKGKKLLEKPVEGILADNSLSLPFCLSWANEAWTRAWNGKTGVVLMSQDYGGADDWKRHYKYLRAFFLDQRYLKVDGKPVFLIYRSADIRVFDEMLAIWDRLARDDGFPGLYIVETLNGIQMAPCSDRSDAVLEFEPMYTMRTQLPPFYRIRLWIAKFLSLVFHGEMKTWTRLRQVPYGAIWSRIVRRKRAYLGKRRIRGAFVDWDNSPRRGASGTIFSGGSPEVFSCHLSKLYSQESGKGGFIFINAWNEWAEGAYLEPDSHYGLGYLEAVAKTTQTVK